MRNPFDRIFKNTAEIEPRAVLHIFGVLKIDEPAEVKELGREIGLEAVHLDHLYEIRTPESHGLHHFEFQSRYQAALPERLAGYGLMAWLRHKLPIHSSLVLPVQKYAPAEIPASFSVAAGGLAIECRYRVIRMWELDPDEIFALDRPPLLVFIPLVSREPRDWNRAAEQIVSTGNRSLASAFIALGGMRYSKTVLEGLLEKVLLEELLKPDWIRHSSVVEPLIDQAKREGRLEGLDQGRLEEARRILIRSIEKRFPDLPIPAAVHAIADPALIEDLHEAIIMAPSAAVASAALVRADASSAAAEPNE